MKLFLVMIISSLFSVTASAQGCASNISELKTLIGNSALPQVWVENNNKADRRLTMRLSNEGSVLGLDLAVPAGNWAHVTGIICKVGAENFVARVATMSWGSQAPKLVKLAGKPKEIKLHLLYPTVLNVSAKGMSFQFNAK